MATVPSPETPTGRRTMAAGHVLVVMLVALTAGALFNAEAILRTAERQELGPVRTVAVGLARPLAAVSRTLFVSEPRAAIDDALGRNAPRRDLEAETIPPAAVPPPAAGTAPPSTTTTTTLPEAGPVRTATAAEPLRLLIIGDSFAELFGPALVNRSIDTGVIDASVDFRFISGLTRPDYFDWPAYLAEELPVVQPDAAVVIFGGNDGQDAYVGGQVLEVGTPAWIDLYHQRVGEAMDTLLAGVERVYWVGMPIMESDTFTAKVQMMNDVYSAEAAARPGVTYVSSFDLFRDPAGEYNAYLDGEQMRYPDGAHFTWNGAYRLADAVMPEIAADWGIAPGA